MTDTPTRPQPELTAAAGPWGGPTYAYRGAEIRCAKGGHVCGLLMEDHPLHGSTFGVVGTVTPLVDLWVEERRLPGYSPRRWRQNWCAGSRRRAGPPPRSPRRDPCRCWPCCPFSVLIS